MGNRSIRALAIAVSLLILATAAAAQQQQVRPPIAQLWIDVATNIVAIPGAPQTFGRGGENQFGNTRYGIGRFMDVALFVRTRPRGTQAAQVIPAAMRLGPNLPLEPVKAERAPGGAGRDPGAGAPPKSRPTL